MHKIYMHHKIKTMLNSHFNTINTVRIGMSEVFKFIHYF